MADPRRLRLRGLGLSEVRALRVLGYAVVVAALVFTSESPRSLDHAEVIRGGTASGGPSMINKRNPAFHLRKYDGTRVRWQLEKLRAEFQEKGPFRVRKGGVEKMLSGEQVIELVDRWFSGYSIILEGSDNIPMTPLYVMRIMGILRQLSERRVYLDPHNRLLHYTLEGYQAVSTATGEPIYIEDDDFPDYRRTMDFAVKNVTVHDPSNPVFFNLTLEQLSNVVDGVMIREQAEVYNPVANEFQRLDQAGLKTLLDYEERIQVNWEDKWFAISKDFFTFMDLRLEQERNAESDPRPPPVSLKDFAAPSGFDPLKLDDDGLFLVTPKMEVFEESRPVFYFSYYHTFGLCTRGLEPYGICLTDVARLEKRFSIRGLWDADREVDEVLFPDPDVDKTPSELEDTYRNEPLWAKVQEELLFFHVPLLENGTSYLTYRYTQCAKYLQQYTEVRKFFPWLRKTLEVADDLAFDDMMKGFSRAIEIPGHDIVVSIGEFEMHLVKNNFSRPMLYCREATGHTKFKTLLSVTICLDRGYAPVDCLADGNCENKVHWALPPAPPPPPAP